MRCRRERLPWTPRLWWLWFVSQRTVTSRSNCLSVRVAAFCLLCHRTVLVCMLAQSRSSLRSLYQDTRLNSSFQLDGLASLLVHICDFLFLFRMTGPPDRGIWCQCGKSSPGQCNSFWSRLVTSGQVYSSFSVVYRPYQSEMVRYPVG